MKHIHIMIIMASTASAQSSPTSSPIPPNESYVATPSPTNHLALCIIKRIRAPDQKEEASQSSPIHASTSLPCPVP